MQQAGLAEIDPVDLLKVDLDERPVFEHDADLPALARRRRISLESREPRRLYACDFFFLPPLRRAARFAARGATSFPDSRPFFRASSAASFDTPK